MCVKLANRKEVNVVIRCVFIAPALVFFATSASAQQNLPEGPGKDTFAKVCSTCHGLDRPMALRRTKEAWSATVAEMAGFGADATQEDFQAIVNYLAKNFGPDANSPVTAGGVAGMKLPDGSGKEVILKACSACHIPDSFVNYRHTPDEWQSIIARMSQRVAASTTKADIENVLKYLTANFPKTEDASKVNMNKATAKEIQAIGFTPEETEAIIDFRKAHGDFREWGEMLVIYGVDGRKVDALKDHMSF
jgi:mono/diheme cytochrome c family protein